MVSHKGRTTNQSLSKSDLNFSWERYRPCSCSRAPGSCAVFGRRSWSHAGSARNWAEDQHMYFWDYCHIPFFFCYCYPEIKNQASSLMTLHRIAGQLYTGTKYWTSLSFEFVVRYVHKIKYKYWFLIYTYKHIEIYIYILFNDPGSRFATSPHGMPQNLRFAAFRHESLVFAVSFTWRVVRKPGNS